MARGALCFSTGSFPQGWTNAAPSFEKRAVDLWTIRLRRTGTLAVEKRCAFPTAHPFAHKLHNPRIILMISLKIRTYKAGEEGDPFNCS